MKDNKKRAKPRILIRAMVDLDSSNTYLYAITRDIAEGGIFVETDNVLPVDSELSIRFTLPNVDQVFAVTTRVAWINSAEEKPGMGLEFKNISQGDKDILADYIERFSKWEKEEL